VQPPKTHNRHRNRALLQNRDSVEAGPCADALVRSGTVTSLISTKRHEVFVRDVNKEPLSQARQNFFRRTLAAFNRPMNGADMAHAGGFAGKEERVLN
jgi:hypothetical protein